MARARRVDRASERISRFMDGSMKLSELTDAERSALRLPIYQAAVRLLEMPRSRVKASAESLPEEVRDLVREEYKRLYRVRRL